MHAKQPNAQSTHLKQSHHLHDNESYAAAAIGAWAGWTPTRSLERMSTRSGLGRLSLPVRYVDCCALYRWTFSIYMSKRYEESMGPPLASGWNWVEKIGRVLWIMPVVVSCLAIWRKVEEGLTFVTAVVEVDEIFLVFVWQSSGINRVAVVLTRDVALAGCQVQSWDVVGSISVFELDGAGTGCEGEELVAEAYTHDWDLGGLHQPAQVVDGLLAVGWVTWAVRDEHAVEVMGDLMDGEVVGEYGDTRTTSNQASENVLFDTAIDDCYVHISIGGIDVERRLSADLLDQVNLLGVNECFILIGIVLFSDRYSCQGRTLLSQECDNGTGIDT
jgi:hypothetical protein